VSARSGYGSRTAATSPGDACSTSVPPGHGPGELEIRRCAASAALVSPSTKGRLGRVWEIEFESTGEAAAGAGLTVVDHISQSMHYEEMLTWVLFYTSLLDLRKTGEQDVLDPGGLVKSQVVQSPDGALRIALNASQSARTQSSRFLTEAFGSGVQHIALATDDMAATVARLEANGVGLLRPRELLRRPRSQDRPVPGSDRLFQGPQHPLRRDGDAEYLQVYTRPSRSASFQKSSSGAAMPVSAPPMPRSASRQTRLARQRAAQD
jgi:4-hydroxyphenylpyruvate dioxygenase